MTAASTAPRVWQMRSVGFLADGDVFVDALHEWRIKLGERTEACAYRLLAERRPGWPSLTHAPNGLPLFVRHTDEPCNCDKLGVEREADL